MAELVKAQNRISAWVAAARALVDNGPTMNLILDIEAPREEPAEFRRVYSAVDDFLRQDNQLPLHSVAETLFPAWEYQRRGLRGLTEQYEAEMAELRPGSGTWGTYADRILRRVNAEGEVTSPFVTMIEKMGSEASNPGPKKACYEIEVADSEFEVGVYRSETDSRMRRNLPCLSHLSFKLHEGAIYLTALYRSHDYSAKALGNLLGLARLQACVGREVGAATGPLIVHSTYAWAGGAKGRLRALLDFASEQAT